MGEAPLNLFDSPVKILDRSGCGACDGSGLVAPSAFHGDAEAWPAYVARGELLAAENGWPESSSPVRAGLVRPLPCPACGAEGRDS